MGHAMDGGQVSADRHRDRRALVDYAGNDSCASQAEASKLVLLLLPLSSIFVADCGLALAPDGPSVQSAVTTTRLPRSSLPASPSCYSTQFYSCVLLSLQRPQTYPICLLPIAVPGASVAAAILLIHSTAPPISTEPSSHPPAAALDTAARTPHAILRAPLDFPIMPPPAAS